jgi:hypothetical protein
MGIEWANRLKHTEDDDANLIRNGMGEYRLNPSD